MFVSSGSPVPPYSLLEIRKKLFYPPCSIHLRNPSSWVRSFRCRLEGKSMKRLSIVGSMKVNAVIFSSILQIGDNSVIQAKNRVFAVQREISQFWGDEGSFAAYPIFNRPIQLPPETGTVAMSVDNLGSVIKVGKLGLLSLSSSAVLQVGSNCILEAESRVLNIRHYIKPVDGEGEDGSGAVSLRDGQPPPAARLASAAPPSGRG
jgi:spore germination protein PE